MANFFDFGDGNVRPEQVDRYKNLHAIKPALSNDCFGDPPTSLLQRNLLGSCVYRAPRHAVDRTLIRIFRKQLS
jgi:hypothetical protein